MLVLARKLHQSILIGDAIRITVLEVRDGQVRLGIDAPRGVSILREEIFRSAASANREAVSPVLVDNDVGALAVLMRLRLSNSGRGDDTCDADA